MDAYTELLERQAKRDLPALSDHQDECVTRASDHQRRVELAQVFGNWIAYDLGPWDWFINPISFRDRHPDLERDPKTGLPRTFRIRARYDRFTQLFDDPRLESWKPRSKYDIQPGPPVPDRALVEISDYLCELQEAAERPIKVLIAEEFGRVEGRYHCHALVGGVAHVRRDEWWKKAFKRFGRTRIEPFDPAQGAAFYCAKYAAKQLGNLHLKGQFPGEEFVAELKPGPRVGRVDVTPTSALSYGEIRRTEFYPRGWSHWRQKR
jgi:hypothetical protein